jgi:hypothetical protein
MRVMHGPAIELCPMIARALTASGRRSMVSVAIVQVMIYMTVKMLLPMKPRSCTDKHPAGIPFGTIVAIRSARIRRRFVIPVRTHRWLPNAHSNLGWSLGSAS